MPELTSEQQEDATKRVGDFLQRYKALIDELQVDFVSYPMFQPNDKGTYDIVIQTHPVDRKHLPQKSFIQP